MTCDECALNALKDWNMAGKDLIRSDGTIRALKPGAGRLSDGSGLYLSPFLDGGAHCWRFDYTSPVKGTRRTLSLGTYPATGLQLARKLATAAREQVAQGLDPSEERKAKKNAVTAQREAETRSQRGEPARGSFEDVARRWFETSKTGWVDGYSSKVISRLQNHVFPYIGALPLSEIRPKTVLDVCRRIEDQGAVETAHRALELCSSVFRFAIAEGGDLSNPCRDLKSALMQPETKNFPALTTPETLAPLLRSIDACHGTAVVRAALKLVPMLMVRPGELRGAQWQEFDLDNALWYIPSERMKRSKKQKATGKPHLVPLPRQAVEVLEDLFLLTGCGEFVFPAEGRAGRTMSENTVNCALRAMGYAKEQVTGHGFRATARTMTVEILGFDPAAAEAQLAHAVPDANGSAYNRTQFIKKRQELMQAWADYLDDLRAGRTRANHDNVVLPQFTPVTRRLGNQPLQSARTPLGRERHGAEGRAPARARTSVE